MTHASDTKSNDTTSSTQSNNGESNAGPVSRTTKQEKSWKQKLARFGVLLLVVLLLGFFALRWVGSTTYRGTVQRVYEKQAEYRVEFTELDGNVHVVGNSEIRFPFFKVNTADLHAELNRMSRTGDIVDVKVWGLRAAWFSMFPNLISVDFVRSDADRTRDRAAQIASRVLQLLQEKKLLNEDQDINEDLILAIENGLKSPEKKIRKAAE